MKSIVYEIIHQGLEMIFNLLMSKMFGLCVLIVIIYKHFIFFPHITHSTAIKMCGLISIILIPICDILRVYCHESMGHKVPMKHLPFAMV